MRDAQKSFTMIELLVVIAIIGLIVSLVLVSFGGQRQKTRITKALEFSSHVGRIMGANVVGWWDFEEGSGTTARDSSGYGNTGTINGATYTIDTPYAAAGQSGGRYALSFDGSNDYVRVGNNASFGQMSGFTLSAWIKTANLTARQFIESVGDTGWHFDILEDVLNKSFSLSFFDNGGPTYQRIFSNPNAIVAANAWYHLVVTFDGIAVTFYRDGAKWGSSNAASGYVINSLDDIWIGSYNGGAMFFDGLIDEVRVYSRALSVGEIQQLYAEDLPRHQLTLNPNP